MTKKRLILILALLGASFGISFALSMLLGGGQAQPKEEEEKKAADAQAAPLDAGPAAVTLRPDERETDVLIKELRSRIEEVKLQQRKLDERHRRLNTAAAVLKSEAQKLESLRVQLVAPLDRLKRAKVELEQARIRIEGQEVANLRAAAAIYDKMSPEESGPILEKMCEARAHLLHRAASILAAGGEDAAAAAVKDAARRMDLTRRDQMEDAVRILRFMNERTAAKALGQITDSEVQRLLMDGLKRLEQKG